MAVQVARVVGAGLYGGGQGGQRERATVAQAAHRRHDPRPTSAAGRSAGHVGCACGLVVGLWFVALVDVGVHRVARAGVCQSH